MEAAKSSDDPVVPKYEMPRRRKLVSKACLLLIYCILPRVFLHATDESALSNGITMDSLKKFAAEPEAQGGGGALEKKAPITAGTTGGIARETH